MNGQCRNEAVGIYVVLVMHMWDPGHWWGSLPTSCPSLERSQWVIISGPDPTKSSVLCPKSELLRLV